MIIKLCHDLGLPHSSWKAHLANQLRIHWTTLLPSITTSSTVIAPTTTAQASSSSLQPALSSTLTHNTTVPTAGTSNTALQPNVTGAVFSNPPQPVIQAYAGGPLQPNVSSLALQVPSIGTTFPLAPASQAQHGGDSLPIALPMTASQANTSGAMLPITLPLTATQANTSGVMLPFTLPLMASQANTSGATLPITLPLLATQANTSGAFNRFPTSECLSWLKPAYSARNGAPTRWEEHFPRPFVQQGKEMAHPVPTKAFLYSQPQHPLCAVTWIVTELKTDCTNW